MPFGFRISAFGLLSCFGLRVSAFLLIFVLHTLHAFGRAAGAEPAIDEGIQFTVHHRLDIAGLDAGTQIFDHPVWLEDVAADLVAPGDAAFVTVKALHFRALFIDALGVKF